MSDNVQLPALGESVTEGTVTRWLKNVGDTVEVDEPLLEVSTDKVDTEIPSPVAGVIEQIVAGGRDRRGRRRPGRHRRTRARLLRHGRRGSPPRSRPSARRRRACSRSLSASRTHPAQRRQSRPRGAGAATPRTPSGKRSLPPLHRGARSRRPGGHSARARRIRHRGHGHSLAQGRRRHVAGRRAAARDLDRQGRHRDPVAVRGHAHRNPDRRGRDRDRRLRTLAVIGESWRCCVCSCRARTGPSPHPRQSPSPHPRLRPHRSPCRTGAPGGAGSCRCSCARTRTRTTDRARARDHPGEGADGKQTTDRAAQCSRHGAVLGTHLVHRLRLRDAHRPQARLRAWR